MKRNACKLIIVLLFIVTAIVNLSINTSKNSIDIDLVQEAQAISNLCYEYYGGLTVCCYPWSGDCGFHTGRLHGPYYYYPKD